MLLNQARLPGCPSVCRASEDRGVAERAVRPGLIKQARNLNGRPFERSWARAIKTARPAALALAVN
jgi:hypothetical protein